jgi:hypothetical protein
VPAPVALAEAVRLEAVSHCALPSIASILAGTGCGDQPDQSGMALRDFPQSDVVPRLLPCGPWS